MEVPALITSFNSSMNILLPINSWGHETMKYQAFKIILLLLALTFGSKLFSQDYHSLQSNNRFAEYQKSLMSSHIRSFGTWANLENSWDYFPPSSTDGRSRMLHWSAKLYQQATDLEMAITKDNSEYRSVGRLSQVKEIREAARQVYDILRFGAHRGDLASSLVSLERKLELLTRQTNYAVKSSDLAKMNQLFSQITRENGHRLTGNRSVAIPRQDRISKGDPIDRKSGGQTGKNSINIGLSAKNR